MGMSSEEPKVASYAEFKGQPSPGLRKCCLLQPRTFCSCSLCSTFSICVHSSYAESLGQALYD